MKQVLQFDQLSCRLKVEGVPDVSVGQSGQNLGIITGWSLAWAGRPELQGRKEHLLALMQVVLPYARYLISGVPRRFGAEPEPVEIGPRPEGGHALLLRSSQPDTPPLKLELDDAELVDLVRVLDQLRLDSRLQLPLELPEPMPLKGRELLERRPLAQRLAAPLAGLLAVALASGLGLLIPDPKPGLDPLQRPAVADPAKGAAPVPPQP